MKITKSLLIWVPLWVCAGGLACHAQGSTLFRHVGAADPVNEGFTAQTNLGAITQPVINDGGFDAWSINLPSAGNIAIYSADLTESQQSALASGWEISLNLRILEGDFGTFAHFVALSTGSEYFALFFGLNSIGDPFVAGPSLSPVYTLNSDGYHNYKLVYSEQSHLAALWVNGTEVTTGIAGSANPTTARFSWGGGQHVGLAHARWNEVSFSIVPEPSSLVLLSLGGLVLAAVRLHLRGKC